MPSAALSNLLAFCDARSLTKLDSSFSMPEYRHQIIKAFSQVSLTVVYPKLKRDHSSFISWVRLRKVHLRSVNISLNGYTEREYFLLNWVSSKSVRTMSIKGCRLIPASFSSSKISEMFRSSSNLMVFSYSNGTLPTPCWYQ